MDLKEVCKSGPLVTSLSSDSLEYEILESGEEHVKSIVYDASPRSSWIDPETLKLSHRIGRGPFGDVWISTHRRSTEDYDGYHEVAVKMLHPINLDPKGILIRFEELFPKCQELEGVCFLHGISVINEKICVVMKFYEGSIGNKMVSSNGGKLSLSDALRYGIDLARGVMELHAKGILILNLKPSNFLLDDQGRAVIGEFGIPWLLLGIPSNSDIVFRLGTPNYMAPEQWEPSFRGPISFETDSWGFACSFVEMLTGMCPWYEKSGEEIHDLVVIQRKRPKVPAGLPPPVENVLNGCFEYDLRNRPLMAHILQEFLRFQNLPYSDSLLKVPGSIKIFEKKPHSDVCSEWLVLKDVFLVGDSVRSRKRQYSHTPHSLVIQQGKIVGLDCDGFVLVGIPGFCDRLRVHSSALERESAGFAAGDWIKIKAERISHSPIGIIHSIDRDGKISAGFVGLETLWQGNRSDVQMAESYYVEQFVKLKRSVVSPRFEWPRKHSGEWATGRIRHILPNGCLIVNFPGRLVFGEDGNFFADPADVEVVSFGTCPGMMMKYQHLEDRHWAVRPLMIALGLVAILKISSFFGRNVVGKKSRWKRKDAKASVHDEEQDAQSASPFWLPSPVAHILFK